MEMADRQRIKSRRLKIKKFYIAVLIFVLLGTIRSAFALVEYQTYSANYHRERTIQETLALARVLVQEGCRLGALFQLRVLTQLAAYSLVGAGGKKIRCSTGTLLTKGLIHCITSDAYGLQK